jgi:hypothetical protein
MEKGVYYLPYKTIRRKYTGIAEAECPGEQKTACKSLDFRYPI